MDIQELQATLNEKGFSEEKQDTGIRYISVQGHVELICYIEPQVEVEFISLYRWDNNEVKGTFNLSITELKWSKDQVASYFRKTKNNIPKQLGDHINLHSEIDKAIGEVF